MTRIYEIRPDNVKKLVLLAETSIPCKIESARALFQTGAAFVTALTFLRKQGVRCEGRVVE